MKRTVLTLAAVAALGGATAVPAQASTCHAVRCLQKQVNALTKVVKIDTKYLVAFTRCMTEIPVTQYGDSSSGSFGYSYDSGDGTGPYLTTAVDATNPGSSVGSWLMTDGCNSQTSATVNFRTSRPALAGNSVFSTALTRLFSYPAGPASAFGPITTHFAALTPHERSH